MLLKFRDYIQTNISVTILILFFSQVQSGASGGRAIKHVAVTTFTNAVIIITGAIAHVYAVEFCIVITFSVVHGPWPISII